MARPCTPSIPLVTDLKQLPIVCDILQFCGATGRKYWSVRKALTAGTCVPAPAFDRPYRWHRHDVEAWLMAQRMTSTKVA
jgi:hypothetical protein